MDALFDPKVVRAILAKLSKDEATVKELAEPFKISGPAITKHLKVLENAGLISRGREGQWRPCRIESEVTGTAKDTERDTFQKEKSGMTQGWTGSFDKLEENILELRGH
ncbi:MAG: winged helix-turn-helix transcriptional regulator [Bdellovibrionaceae bacterium]|nr:winged helix-turn-helix transcriptional regulator [Pseudobdellovibrionaceae bacterium]